MADNVTIPATGVGSVTPVVATDEISNVHYQYMKLVDGTADSTEKISGDSTNGLDVDVTRVQGTVNVAQSTASSLNVTVGPSTNNIGDIDVLTIPAPLNVTGGGLESSALRVTIANDSTGVLSIDDNGSTLSIDDGGSTITVDGTVSAAQSGTWNINSITEVVHIDDNSGSITVDGSVSATQSGTWNISTLTGITNVVHVDDNNQTLSVDDGGSSLTVDGTITANAGTGTFNTKETRSTSVSVSSVAGSASSVNILSSNSSRLGATIYNDSSAILYLKLGTTATSSSFTIKMQPESYYEVPYMYTGNIDGIWASATGSARVTELS